MEKQVIFNTLNAIVEMPCFVDVAASKFCGVYSYTIAAGQRLRCMGWLAPLGRLLSNLRLYVRGSGAAFILPALTQKRAVDSLGGFSNKSIGQEAKRTSGLL